MAHQMTAQIQALLAERRGYLVRGLQSRVDAVDAALRQLGYEVETSAVEHRSETAELPIRKRRRAVTDGDN
jgi:hypothetical protein